VLEREGVPINLIVGTSMGSVVGGLYAAGVPVSSIEEKFVTGELMRSFLTVPLAVRIIATPLFDIPRLFGFKRLDGMYNGGRFAKFLDGCIPEESHELSHLKIPFAAVALNLIDGQVYTITKGEFGRAIQASAAVPVLRKPVPIGDKLFVDGGVTANLPVSQARQLGADIVIAVDVDERFEPVSIDAFKQTGSVAHRVLTLHLSKVDEQQLRQADIVIHPPVNGIGLISTKPGDLRSAIAAGERAAQESMPDVKRLLEARGVLLNQGSTALNEASPPIRHQ
jgi:NTE family protein